MHELISRAGKHRHVNFGGVSVSDMCQTMICLETLQTCVAKTRLIFITIYFIMGHVMTLIRHAREGTPRKDRNLLNEPRMLEMVVGKRRETAVERSVDASTAKEKQNRQGRRAESRRGRLGVRVEGG